MNIKIITGSFYLAFLYGISIKFPSIHMMFFPTTGAFCFLFSIKSFHAKEIQSIIIGSLVSSVIGCSLYYLNSGPFSLLAVSLIVMGMIKKFNWNAPPIVAITLIPFYSHQIILYEVPVFVLCSLCGAILLFWLTDKAAHLVVQLRSKRLSLGTKNETLETEY